MSDSITASQKVPLAVGDKRNLKASFNDLLASGETLTGTPLVTEETTDDLTITNKAINSSAVTINGVSVAIGKVVQFTVEGQLKAGSPYTVKIEVVTSASQEFTRYVILEVER